MLTLTVLLSADKDLTDKTLLDSYITEIACGDTHALEQLYRSTSSSVYSYALSILKCTEDAEDVLHDCYLSIYSAAAGYEARGKPMAWILTITKNLCLKKLRDNSRVTVMSDDDIVRLTENPVFSHDERLILEECMRFLSDKERQIVVLHAVSGFRHREIAELMELPLSTVLSKYNRAIAKLRKKL